MGPSKNISFIAFTLLLLAVSCGKEPKSSSSSQEMNSICAGLDCLTSVKWKILLVGKQFPDRTKVTINGATIVNECFSKQKYSITRNTDPQHLEIDNYYIPKKGSVKIEIVDLGADCRSETTFVSDKDVAFEVNKTNETPEVLIHL